MATPVDYYMAVTRAEALLILNRVDEAAAVLRSELVRTCRNQGDRSSTAGQLAMIAAHVGMGDDMRTPFLAPLAPPRVAHFCGHMFAADPALESRLREEIDAIVRGEDIGFAYGALACGGDPHR